MKRIAVIGFWQETNTFNPHLTTTEAFLDNAMLWGEEALGVQESYGELSGTLDGLNDSRGDRVEPIIVGFFWGSVGGRVDNELVDLFEHEMRRRLVLASRVDGVLMLLHGASCSTTTDDIEGRLIAAVRQTVRTTVPIGVALDHHANVTRLMMLGSTYIIGHRTEPHDPHETAYRSAILLCRILDGEMSVSQSWRKMPMVTHQEHFETAGGPMKEWFSEARRAETLPGVAAVSPFPVQPWLDVDELGWAVTVVADSDAKADQIAAEIAQKGWNLRRRFLIRKSVSIDEAIRRTAAASDSLVLLHDMGDSVYAGSTGASTQLLERLLEAALQRTCLIPLVAPELTAQAYRAGIGHWVHLGDTANERLSWLHPRAQVVSLDAGQIEVNGLLGKRHIDEGRTALLQMGDALLHVTERSGAAGADQAAYTRHGVAVPSNAVLVVKMAAAYPGFDASRQMRIQVDTSGYTQSDLSSLSWSRAPRPLFGLDPDVNWSANPLAE